MRKNLNISLDHEPEELNEILIRKYGYSLFCFALVYANVFINETFLGKSFSISSKNKQRLIRYNQYFMNLKKTILRKLKDYLSFKYPFSNKQLSMFEKANFDPVCNLSEFFKFIDREVNENKWELSNLNLKLKRGIYMYPETKIAMIYSYIMNKKINIDRKLKRKLIEKMKNFLLPKLNIDYLDKKYNDFFFNISAKLEMNKFNPNWDDIFNLIDWFHYYTAYGYLLKKDKGNKIKERIRKYNEKYLEQTFGGLLTVDLLMFISQHFYEEMNINTPISWQFKDFYYENYIYPTFSIKFGEDFITIGKIKGNNLIYKKYIKSNSTFKKKSERKSITKKDKIPYEILFSTGEQFLFKHLKLQP